MSLRQGTSFEVRRRIRNEFAAKNCKLDSAADIKRNTNRQVWAMELVTHLRAARKLKEKGSTPVSVPTGAFHTVCNLPLTWCFGNTKLDKMPIRVWTLANACTSRQKSQFFVPLS